MSHAAEVVISLAATRKASQLYPHAHPAFAEVMDGMMAAVSTATAEGSFQLNIHEGRLYHESDVLPDGAPAIASIEEAFESRRIESLTLHAGCTPEDILGLVEVLTLRPSPDLDAQDELGARNVEHVTIAVLEDDDSGEREERERMRAQDRQLYNKLVGALRAMSTQVAQGSATDLSGASGMVESILNRLMMDQAAVLGLATIKGQTEVTLFHSINVMIYSLTLGSTLGLPAEGLTSLGLSALLHDIGKAAFKTDDPAQAEPMRLRHPTIGADILSRMSDDDAALMLVAYEHHMQPDGEGYPDAPDDYVTHPYSRMIAIANRYANLSAPTGDAEPLTPDKAIIEILREAGTHLDPMFARLFTKAMGVFPVGCMVRLSDQTVGVVSSSGDNVLAPRVRVLYEGTGLTLDDPYEIDLADSELQIIEVVDPDSLDVEVSEHL